MQSMGFIEIKIMGFLKRYWWKILSVIIFIIILAFFAFVPIGRWLRHEKIMIGLPFTEQNDAEGLIPMGETINHPFHGGHPGIDFQWYHHSVPLIASTDGIISDISKHDEGGFEVEIDSGWYRTGYLGIEVTPNLKVGQKIQKGDVLGEPYHATNLPDNNPNLWGFHWEFGYVSLLKNEICPLIYFDTNSKERIEKIWDRASYNEKSRFPYICSGFYYGHDK